MSAPTVAKGLCLQMIEWLIRSIVHQSLCYTFYSPMGIEPPFYYLCTSLLLKKFNLRAVFWRVLSTGWFGSTSMYVRVCQINNIVISVLHIWWANSFHYRKSCFHYKKSSHITEISLLVFSYYLNVIEKEILKKKKKSREFNALSFVKLGLEYIHISDLKYL